MRLMPLMSSALVTGNVGDVVRPGMDRVCQPGRSLHDHLPGSTDGHGNDLDVAVQRHPPGAYL